MDSKRLLPIHPGEILSEEFLVPLNMTQKQLADHIGHDLPGVIQAQ